MGKDKHEARLKRRRSKDAVLGPMTEQVLGPRPSDHKNVIDQLTKPFAGEVSPSDTTAQAHPAPAQNLKRKATMANDATDTGSTKTRNLKYSYLDRDDKPLDGFGPDVRSLVFTLAQDENKKLVFGLAEIITDKELLERIAEQYPMAICSMAMGLKTTTGNAVTSVKTGDVGEMFEAITERKSTIVEDKEWREGGQRGPSGKAVLEALLAAYKADTGREPTEQKRDQFKALIKEKGTKQVLANAKVNAEFEAAKLRKQEEAVRKAKAAADAESNTEMAELFAD